MCVLSLFSPGNKALGCHIQPSSSSTEQYRSHYPISTGTSCTCYDYYSSSCISSCAQVNNYEVVTTSGSGFITATCSDPLNRVLGCGILPDQKRNNERFRTVRVTSGNTCTCYDAYYPNCYAICGKIW